MTMSSTKMQKLKFFKCTVRESYLNAVQDNLCKYNKNKIFIYVCLLTIKLFLFIIVLLLWVEDRIGFEANAKCIHIFTNDDNSAFCREASDLFLEIYLLHSNLSDE